MNTTMTGGTPTAMGGDLFVSDTDGALMHGTIDVSINDGQYRQTMTTNSSTNFFDLVSRNGTQIANFQATATQPLVARPFFFPTVNELILAKDEPGPTTYALGALSAMTLGLVSRRHQAK